MSDFNETNQPNRDPLKDALSMYDKNKKQPAQQQEQKDVVMESMPKTPTQQPVSSYIDQMGKETDPDLMTVCESIKLPSEGLLYKNKITHVDVEYMTSKDEDLLTTPSLLENGTALSKLLKRKIKTKDVDPDFLLQGDRDKITLFLRTSSYGSEYDVEVTDPRTGKTFKSEVDLTKLKHKVVTEQPDNNGEYSIFIPMRKKLVKFRLLNFNEDEMLAKKAEALQHAYTEEVNHYQTMKLKTCITSIDGNADKTYIDKFVDAMPARDALTIRKHMLDVSPGVDMSYEFKALDGFKFNAYLSIGADFFFPNN